MLLSLLPCFGRIVPSQCLVEASNPSRALSATECYHVIRSCTSLLNDCLGLRHHRPGTVSCQYDASIESPRRRKHVIWREGETNRDTHPLQAQKTARVELVPRSGNLRSCNGILTPQFTPINRRALTTIRLISLPPVDSSGNI